MGGELLKLRAGIEMTHIPFKGGADSLTALLGSQVQMTIDGGPHVIGHIKSGALRMLAVATLISVMRHLETVRDLKQAFPELAFMGSGYTYLQEFLPNVAQAVVREGWVDVVGLGRMVLAYPELPADVLAGRAMQRKRLCRTFSDCSTAQQKRWQIRRDYLTIGKNAAGVIRQFSCFSSAPSLALSTV